MVAYLYTIISTYFIIDTKCWPLRAKTYYLFEHIINSYKIKKYNWLFIRYLRYNYQNRNCKISFPPLENENRLYIQEFPQSL